MMCADHQRADTDHGGHQQKTAECSSGGMVEQVSGDTRPRWGTDHYHQGKPLVILKIFYFRVLQSCPTGTCCQHRPSLYLLLVLKLTLVSTACAQHQPQLLSIISGCGRWLLHLPLLLSGD
uniref:Uncharacterized protein n=1 Tax=Pipistrellus kuhlii TaxID=59472 RepID=A0A7J7WDA1_PIPKU|nr:hypothetical protein mPipKuh1_008026 [Pipistrellus kuhlii]